MQPCCWAVNYDVRTQQLTHATSAVLLASVSGDDVTRTRHSDVIAPAVIEHDGTVVISAAVVSELPWYIPHRQTGHANEYQMFCK